MEKLNIVVNNPEDTILLGEILTKHLSSGSFIALSGDLGAGKTTFTKGIGKALGIKRVINSPTFTIMKTYDTNNLNGIDKLYHLDVYRLMDSSNDFELEEYFYLDGLTVVEWCDIISDLIPDDYLRIDLKITSINSRIISIQEIGNISILSDLEKELKELNYEIICG